MCAGRELDLCFKDFWCTNQNEHYIWQYYLVFYVITTHFICNIFAKDLNTFSIISN